MNTNATHTTPNYGLPLFIATDKPAWLIDWNNTMSELDTKLKEIADAGDNTHILDILGDDNQGLIHDVETLASSLSALTSRVGDCESDIETIQGQITNIQNDLTTQNQLYVSLEARVTALENA